MTAWLVAYAAIAGGTVVHLYRLLADGLVSIDGEELSGSGRAVCALNAVFFGAVWPVVVVLRPHNIWRVFR